MASERNWAGNYRYRAARIHYPESVDEVRRVVAASAKVKALGSRHSFNDIADCDGDLISLSKLPRVISVNVGKRTVTVDGGARYGDLCPVLASHGLALPNLASLPHISVAGACATATHGSGDKNAVLAASVSAIKVVVASGDIVEFSRESDPNEFGGAVVNLGALGVVTEMTLDLVPEFAVRQDVYEDLLLTDVEESFEEIVSSAYSVSLFTDWQGKGFSQVWRKSVVESVRSDPQWDGEKEESSWYSATRATGALHPISSMSADCCTEQMGVPGPWHARLAHFRLEYTPSAGEELQSEYFVPRRHAVEAIRRLFDLGPQLASSLLISEVRTIAADSIWLSPCRGQNSVAFHFTWQRDWPAVRGLLPMIEAALESFDVRPHWGKLFTMSPDRLRSLYPMLAEFRRLRDKCDPDGKFRNEFLIRLLGD